MTDPGRSGYAVSAGKDGDASTASATVTNAVPQPTTNIATAVAHLRAAVAILERVAKEV